MATNQILQRYPTVSPQWMWNDITDFPNSGDGPPTTAANDIRISGVTRGQIDLTSLAAAAARQADKQQISSGGVWPEFWTLGSCIEWPGGGLPTAGGTVDFYANFSPNTTAATGNSGGATGSDGAFTAASVDQLVYLGAMVVHNSAINIDTDIATFRMPYPDMSIIVVNNTDAAFHTVMDETNITITAVVPDIQASA